jgi:DNA mismatch endonuclease (patch repair protein)
LRKFKANQARDAVVKEKILAAGLRHLIIWECAIRGPDKLGLEQTTLKAVNWLRSSKLEEQIRGRPATDA